MLNVCNALLARKIIPVINENDPVVGEGIKGVKVGDNDTLSALVAGLIDADLLVILSDIDGLYDKNPSEFKGAKFINLVENIDENVIKAAGAEGSKFGTGGMRTKITAAQMATKNGTNLIIANGFDPQNILHAEQKGSLIIDEGAAKALAQGKSLLSVGVKEVSGKFERGEIVEIKSLQGKSVARGISNYSAGEITLIKGRKSDEIEGILGYKYDDVVIHIDNNK